LFSFCIGECSLDIKNNFSYRWVYDRIVDPGVVADVIGVAWTKRADCFLKTVAADIVFGGDSPILDAPATLDEPGPVMP
jgi:hypothetical protein